MYASDSQQVTLSGKCFHKSTDVLDAAVPISCHAFQPKNLHSLVTYATTTITALGCCFCC